MIKTRARIANMKESCYIITVSVFQTKANIGNWKLKILYGNGQGKR